MLRRDIREAAGQEDGIGHIEHGTDVGHAGPSGTSRGWHSATSATAVEYFRPTASKT